jgi:hypothetical protein
MSDSPRGPGQAASSALAAHLNQEQIDAGQQWASQLFEHIRAEYQERVSVEIWGWKDDWPRDFIHLQICDDDTIYLIPTGDRGFTVARIVECGNPDPVHEPSRREMTQAMYRMCATLAHPERTLHVAAWPAHDRAIVSRSGFL